LPAELKIKLDLVEIKYESLMNLMEFMSWDIEGKMYKARPI